MATTKTLGVRALKRMAKKSPVAAIVADPHRPTSRGGCQSVERPCPYVACRYHLHLDVKEGRGALKVQLVPVEDMAESCALDVAAQGAHPLEFVGDLLGVTRERIRQEEKVALAKLRDARPDLEKFSQEPMGDTAYVGAPADNDLDTIKAKDSPTWIKNLWHAALMHAETP